VGAGNWESGEELGDTWASRNAYSYGRCASCSDALLWKIWLHYDKALCIQRMRSTSAHAAHSSDMVLCPTHERRRRHDISNATALLALRYHRLWYRAVGNAPSY